MVICLDGDAFYAQVLVRSRPELKGRPVVVAQKYIVASSSHEARKLGVPKMTTVDKAMEICPSLVVLDGSDLTPFRSASEDVFNACRAALAADCAVERQGLDEVYVDATNAAKRLVADQTLATGRVELVGQILGEGSNVHPLLAAGSQIARELKSEVMRRVGVTFSAGVAFSRFGAKLATSCNKPDGLTTLGLASHNDASEFLSLVSDRPASLVPGLGWARFKELCNQGVLDKGATVGDLAHTPPAALAQVLGGDVAHALLEACAGGTPAAVSQRGAETHAGPVRESLNRPQQQVTCELTTLPHPTDMVSLERRTLEVCDRLAALLADRRDRFQEFPTTLRVAVRFAPARTRFSKSVRLGPILSVDKEVRKHAVRLALAIAHERCHGKPFRASCVNVGGVDFERA